MSGDLWLPYADMPDSLRVAQALVYTSPDGRQYLAPLGTADPDPDRPLGRQWTEIRYVRDPERR